jgi:hypothetical protein
VGLKTDTKKKKIGLKYSKRKRDSLPKGSVQEILQKGAESSGASSKPTVEVSVKGRDEPVMRHMPAVTSRTPLLEVSSSDTPLQGASSSSIPAGGGQTFSLRSKQATPSKGKTDWMHQARQEPGMSMLEETLTGTSKRPSSGGSTPVERARDP